MASRSFLKNRLIEIEKAVNVGNEIHIKVDGFSCEIYEKDRTIFYNPSETAIKFHESSSLVKGLMGPIGSGKTTINIWDMIIEAVKMPRCKDGVRRYRGIIIRNTYSELQTTTLKSWMEWFGALGNAKLKESSPIRYRSVFSDSEGEIEIEVYFLSMDREDNVKKLDSLETTRVFINEMRHVPLIVIGRSQGRLRYPKREEIGSYRGHVAFDTNPPKVKSELFDLFEKERPEGYELIKQPPGLIKVNNKYVTNPRADNLMHLSDEYYTNSAKGQTEEHIKVMLLGEYGITEGKKRIYHEYNHDLHSVDSIEYMKGRAIYMGIDYETLPSVIISQTTQNGRIFIIKELIAHKSGFKSFCENILLPYINTNLAGYEFIITDDPAGSAMKPTDEKNCRMILAEFGLQAMPAYSNLTDTRIGVVKEALNDMVDGSPKLCVSRDGCPTLIEGFMEGYHYKTVMTADGLQSTGKPEKNKFADIHDGLQYDIMGILGQPHQKTTMKPKLRPRGVFI